jgi:tetratricopeptide (TPR) repeat protein
VVVGFLVKEPAVMFAPLLFLYLLIFDEPLPLTKVASRDGLRGFGRAVKGALPAFAVSAGLFSLSRAMTPSGFTPGGTDRWRYLLTQPFVIFHYFANFLLPVNLAVESDWEPFANVFDDRVTAGLLFVLLLVALAFRLSRRPEGRPVAFGLLWFFVTLAPTSSVIPLAEVLNDHRPFFGYVGLTLAACGLACLALKGHEGALARSWAWRAAIAGAIVLLLSAHAFGVRARNQVWSSAESLWGEAARKSPGSGRVLMNYGLTLMARGDYAGAVANFDKARAAWPNYSYIHINLGVAEQALGNPAKAEVHFRDALGLDPQNPEAYAYYAPFLRKQGREHEAQEVARRGLLLSPGHLGLKAFLESPAPPASAAATVAPSVVNPPADATPESLLDVSLALYRAGRYQESLATAQRAAALRPDWDLAWNNVCAAFNSLGRWDDAIAAGEKAVRLNPGNAYAKGNLDWARRQKALAAPAR